MDQFEEEIPASLNFSEQLAQLQRGQQLLQLALSKYQSDQDELTSSEHSSTDSQQVLEQENYDEILVDCILKCHCNQEFQQLFDQLSEYHKFEDSIQVVTKILQFVQRLIINVSYQEVISKQQSNEQIIKKLNDDNFRLKKDMQEMHSKLDIAEQKLIKQTQINREFSELQIQLKTYQGDTRLLKQLKIKDLSLIESNSMKLLKNIQEIKTATLLEHEKNKLCTICYENKICILLRPCGHANVCEFCIYQIKQCPLDRKTILSWEKIFLP